MSNTKTMVKNKPVDKSLNKLNERHAGAEHDQFRELVPALLSSSQSVFYIAQDKKLQVVTSQLSRLTGFSQEELLGRDPLSIVHPDDSAVVRENAVKMLRGERSKPYEFRTLDKAGNIHYIMEAVTSITYKGKPAILGNWVELTERKQAEQALRESEEKYRAIFEQASDSIILIDTKTEAFVDFNGRAHQNLGYSREEFAKLKVTDIDVVESHENTIQHREKTYRGETDVFETKHRTKDGEIRDVLVSIKMLNIGSKMFSISVWHDITERKRAEEALQESEQFSSSLMRSSAIPILVVNDDTSMRYVNPAFEKLTGFALEEVIGKMAPYPWWLKDAHSGSVTELKRDVHAGVRRLEKLFWKKNGEQFWVEITSAPVKYDGKFQYSLENWLDITERKRAEEALQESEEKYRAIFEQASDSIVLVDPETTEILGFNDRAYQNLGYSREEFAKLKITDLEAIDSAEEVKKNMKKINKEGIESFETKHRTKSGEIRDFQICTRSLQIGGRNLSYGIWHDITERKNMEDELRTHRDHLEELIQQRTNELSSLNKQLEKELAERKRIEDELRIAIYNADAANRAKGDFLARMSHEIRTPIHGVMGTLDLLRDTELGQEQRQYVGMARASSETLLNVINDILDFSKIEAGKIELEDRDFNLRIMLQETLATMAIPAHRKGLEILLQVSRDMPMTLIGDAGRLRQVLINLLGNAVKFTEHGEIILRVDVEADGEKETELHFSVKDTGIGIPKEKQELLFHPFEQADGSMTRKYGGSGLGLSICKQLVSMMSGRIWFTSWPGEGSIFHFTAKFVKQTAGEQAEDLPQAPSELRGMPLLLIDDNATCRSMLRDWLNEWGFQVSEVDNGRSALKELEDAKGTSRHFRIVLLDKTMPKTNGFAVAEQILRDPALRVGIVMMLPSNSISDDFGRCQELGISHYLVKPIKESELLNTILAAVGLTKTAEEATKQAMPAHQSTYIPHFRILVAEDNATSQLIAKKTLEKVGHAVQIASSGVEAIRMVKEDDYDLVLMDVEMPEMNGLEATQFIRKTERKSGQHIPIIAMTAYAMQEDRQRCLQAGMDAYLSKPMNPDELYNVMRGISFEKNDKSEVVDIEAALKLVGGDEDILKEVMGVFLEQDYPEQLKRLKEGIDQHDAQTVQAAAHSIKGATRSFGSASLSSTALRLEEMGRNNDLAGAEAALQELEQEAKQFADFFARYNGQGE